MFSLTIDGRPAVIKKGTSIKLTRENPFFAQTGDYTLDVTLPLAGCPENQEIFGSAHRHESDAARVSSRRSFRLVADFFSIAGRARIMQINEKEVKVQLLSGNSALGIDGTDAEGKDIYIDELDLGYAYDNIFPQIPTKRQFADYFFPENASAALWEELEIQLHGTSDETDFVLFPVYSYVDENVHGWANQHSYFGGRPRLQPRWWPDTPPSRAGTLVADSYCYAAQIYLLPLVQRVLSALGYEADFSAFAGDWRKDIFVCSHRDGFEVAKQLPHWTVEEFLIEVRNFLGCYFTVSGPDVRARYNRSVLTDGSTVVLKQVAATHTFEYSNQSGGSSEKRTVADGNVEYKTETDDPMLHLPDEVWQRAEILTFPGVTSESYIIDYINANFPTTAERNESRWLFCLPATGKVYALLKPDPAASDEDTYVLTEVDVVPARIRPDQFSPTGRDIDVTLKIVPVRHELNKTGYSDNQSVWTPDGLSIPAPVTEDDLHLNPKNRYSVAEALQGGENEVSEKEEILPVAWNPGATYSGIVVGAETFTTVQVAGVVGTGYMKNTESGFYQPLIGLSDPRYDQLRLSLREIASGTATDLGIDTESVLQVQFLDDVADPMHTYIIAGRRYVCKKIELTIDERGLAPLKTGWFVPVAG